MWMTAKTNPPPPRYNSCIMQCRPSAFGRSAIGFSRSAENRWPTAGLVVATRKQRNRFSYGRSRRSGTAFKPGQPLRLGLQFLTELIDLALKLVALVVSCPGLRVHLLRDNFA